MGAVMETGSVEENEDEEENHHGKENQRPNNQIGRFEFLECLNGERVRCLTAHSRD